MVEHLISARTLASTAAVTLLVSLAGCATVPPGDRPAAPSLVSSAHEPQEQVPCIEGLELRPGDSCIHKGDRFWVKNGQACYSGRYLGPRQSDPFCSPLHHIPNEVCLDLNEVCLDGQCAISSGDSSESDDCRSDAFGFGADPVAGTSNWQVSQVRQVQHVEWDGRSIRIEGTCRVTPGTLSKEKGACLRLQISPPGGACIVGDNWFRRVCTRLDGTLLLKSLEWRINGHTECEEESSTSYSPVVCEAY